MKLKIFAFIAVCAFTLTSCNDVLDRPSITTMEDDKFWTGEDRVRLYANSFYTNFFVGYGLGYGETAYTPNINYSFNDDMVRKSTQAQFLRSVPSSKGSTSLGLSWESQFSGPTWNRSHQAPYARRTYRCTISTLDGNRTFLQRPGIRTFGKRVR